jgi:rhodanese-related sulfurtransferase
MLSKSNLLNCKVEEAFSMEFLNYFIIALFLGFFLQRIIPVKGIRNISTGELSIEIGDTNKQFVDVRTHREYKGNHINGFKNIPLDQLSKKAETELTKEKEVIVICQSGIRSKMASKSLKKMGFTKVTNVKGGMSAWS